MKGRIPLLLLLLFVTACVRIDIRFPTPRAAVTYIASSTGDDSATAPLCTEGHPCSVRRGLLTMDCANNDVLELLDGVYQGANYMLDIGTVVPGKGGTSNTARCTVRARNELGVGGYVGPGVFIDGQFQRWPFYIDENHWWRVTGIDFGNSNTIMAFWGPENGEFKRLCFSNTRTGSAGNPNGHVLGIQSAKNSLFEDFCVFGTGRNTIQTGIVQIAGYGPLQNNTLRRFFVRFEGNQKVVSTGLSDSSMDGMVVQATYSGNPGNGTGGNVYENFITVWGPEQQNAPMSSDIYGGLIQRGYADTLDKFYGWIAYGYDGYTGPNTVTTQAFVRDAEANGTGGPRDYKDIFSDARSQTGNGGQPFALQCVGACAGKSADRLTGLRQTSGAASTNTGFTLTNGFPTNECTTPGTCPNFYTGGSPGTGSRACFQYTNGVLGTTAATQALWPWPMDERIKAALARARAAGTGGTALTGGAGSGYSAATVTSEIAARYGPVPAACTRTTSSFVPPFPVVTDFPSTSLIDTFTRADGSVGASYTATTGSLWTIASNQAVAPASFARNAYNAATFAAAHEVHAKFATMPGVGGPSTLLTFSGSSAANDATQWRLMMTRAASANATVILYRAADGETILGPIDLGADVSDGQSFGVRVSALQTVSVYWKYSDGQWYRVGSVIDTNLPNLPASATTIGFGSAAPTQLDDFGGGTCCGGAVQPGTIGRFGLRFPTQ
jgi:hypothetical protein